MHAQRPISQVGIDYVMLAILANAMGVAELSLTIAGLTLNLVLAAQFIFKLPCWLKVQTQRLWEVEEALHEC